MTDILDEILAYTEGIHKREHQQNDQGSGTLVASDVAPMRVSLVTSNAQPVSGLGRCAVSSLPHSYLAQQFAPSPRGVQDDISPFSIMSQGQAGAAQYSAKTEVLTSFDDSISPGRTVGMSPHKTRDDANAAAAAAAAISACMRPGSISRHPDGLEFATQGKLGVGHDSSIETRPEDLETSGVGISSVGRLSMPQDHRPSMAMSSSAADPVTRGSSSGDNSNGLSSRSSLTIEAPQSSWNVGTKRLYQNLGIYREASSTANFLSSRTGSSPVKKVKSEASVVMPPSAKSILERRERAIREGRRKDAKLTDAERRILRRLRNRESAERCRLRRVQQAAQLEEQIECMQVENNRLVAMAEEYERTIQRLEKVIEKFSVEKAAGHFSSSRESKKVPCANENL